MRAVGRPHWPWPGGGLLLGLAVAGCGGGDPLLSGDPEVVIHDGQPMVVDVRVPVAPGSAVSLTHETDPGVVIRAHADDVHRARGLRPDTDHSVTVRVERAGRSESRTVAFRTAPPLPGFQAAFAVEGSGRPTPGYRLFDFSSFGGPGKTVGAAMVDEAGVTRWYLGEEHPEVSPQALWAAIRLRDDGTIMYVRQDAFVIADELGQDVLRVTADELGVAELHHDAIELPGGSFLIMSVAFQTFEYPEEGEHMLYGDQLLEIDPAGEVVWRWNAFDHLDPRRRRNGFHKGLPLEDPETGRIGKDWTHGNAIVHLPDDDSILISLRHQDWILKIDHVTGDVIWRFGEEGDFTLTEGTWFFHQHCPEIQTDGSLLLYDNGVGDPDRAEANVRSRAVRYALDERNMTARQVWQSEPDVLSSIMSDADTLPGGNVLVLDSSLGFENGWDHIHSRLREVDPGVPGVPGADRWSIGTRPGRFFYRASHHDRLVGEPAARSGRPPGPARRSPGSVP